jgi:serine/threonine protein kinase
MQTSSIVISNVGPTLFYTGYLLTLPGANVLITEQGGVQLCDFGVAGIQETKIDKRSTFIGTPNWMAPELFDPNPFYGKEIDIWAFGAMAYEMATGLPPNALSGVRGMDLGPYLKQHIPRLPPGDYSDGLEDLVAFCLTADPSQRPPIEAVQRHLYLANTQSSHPESILSDLVKAFKKWEELGGSRKSLFMAGGAQGPSELSPSALNDLTWNFSTTDGFDVADVNAQDVLDAYGSSMNLRDEFEASRRGPKRRRPPPEVLAPLKGALEKAFDPNTMLNYNQYKYEQSRNMMLQADLPLRDDSAQTSIRDTIIDMDMIDLGGHDPETGMSSFPDGDTIRPVPQPSAGYGVTADFSRPALSDPADNPNRRTLDWTFPVSVPPPASANPELSRFPPQSYEPQQPSMTPASGGRPVLRHHPTEPISVPSQSFNSLAPSGPGSPNRMSLIDLDLSLPEPTRPSTSDSSTSNDLPSANPFMWEKLHGFQAQVHEREPSIYFEQNTITSRLSIINGNGLNGMAEASDFSASDAEGPYMPQYDGGYDDNAYEPTDYHQSAMPEPLNLGAITPRPGPPYDASRIPPLPAFISEAVMSGTATHNETASETLRILDAFKGQLEFFREAYTSMPPRRTVRGSIGGT